MSHYDEARGLLAAQTNGSAGIIAAATHAAPSKATPVDADELPLADSAASFGLAKLTWANVKATLASWLSGGTLAASLTTLNTSDVILASKANSVGSLIGARFNATNQKIGFNIANANGFATLAWNSSSGVGTDTFAYTISQAASRIYADPGTGAISLEAAATGVAGNNITFVRMLTATTTGVSVFGAFGLSGLFFPQQATTAGAPAYSKGAVYFDTTPNKLRIGGATAWETVTSI